MRWIVILLLLIMHTCGADPQDEEPQSVRQKVFVYNGPGADPYYVKAATEMISTCLSPASYEIDTINLENLRQEGWQQQTALLMMPSGYEPQGLEELTQNGAAQIKRYVEESGLFWGSGAGAYYASQSVTFCQQEKGERPLGFFPGVACGPVYNVTQPFDLQHLRETLVTFSDTGVGVPPTEDCCTFSYFGGAAFRGAESFHDVTTFARYAVEDTPAAIIGCRVGRGKSLLTGPQLEVSAATALASARTYQLEERFPNLASFAEQHKTYLRYLLGGFLELHLASTT